MTNRIVLFHAAWIFSVLGLVLNLNSLDSYLRGGSSTEFNVSLVFVVIGIILCTIYVLQSKKD